jgi:hypothetical protein
VRVRGRRRKPLSAWPNYLEASSPAATGPAVVLVAVCAAMLAHDDPALAVAIGCGLNVMTKLDRHLRTPPPI